MRIHSDVLTAAEIYGAAPMHGDVEISHHGSRSRLRAFEVHMTWSGPKMPGDGRRPPGNGGAGQWAMTWDEWGWFIDALYHIDPQATIGPYNDQQHFYQLTERQSRGVQAYGTRCSKASHQAGWLPWRQDS